MKSAPNLFVGLVSQYQFVRDQQERAAAKTSETRKFPQPARMMSYAAVLGVFFFASAIERPASAITIDIEYSTDTGGDESPSWDANGNILKAHFQAAKVIWEALLPGPGSYSFDFQWDDDIPGLGLTNEVGLDLFVEINPNNNWYADPTPNDNAEFAPGVQTLVSNLSSGNQTAFFPGTAPPSTLEVGFRGTGMSGFPSDSGQMGVNAMNGNDLLSTVVHEIGHVLGIFGVEPGEYNIFPQHVGGLNDVLVLEDNDSPHLGLDGTVPVLMCQDCGAPGVRRFPTATDVLVIAEDQGITNVRLARVGSISSGVWSNTNRWIGGAVPNLSQDVYISHGGTVTLDINATTNNLRVDPGNMVDVANNRLDVDGMLTMTGATVNVDPGGTLAANNLARGNGTLTGAAGSLVRFNTFSSTVSGPIVFSGSVGIGYDKSGPSTVTFSLSMDDDWLIGEQLRVGDENTTTTFVIDNASTVTSAGGRIGTDFNGGGEGIVDIDGPGSSWTNNGVLDGRNGLLNITGQGQMQSGDVFLGADEGEMRAGVDGNGSLWTINGDVDIGPSILTGSGQGGLTVQNNGLVNVSGDIDLHGTSTVQSFVLVQSNGTLDVDGDITIGPFGSVQLLGSTIRTGKLLPFLGTFTWTNGTLDLTNQAVVLDSALPPLPLASTTTLQNSQTLLLNGAGRNLTVGDSANGQLDMLNSASVEVNDGDVFIARNAGSTGQIRLLNQGTNFFVDGAMAVGGSQSSSGGTGQLLVAGDVTVTEALTYWPTASVQVEPSGVLSADILRRGGGVGGGLNVGMNGRVRFNMLNGFGANISMGGISMIGIAEGDTGQGALVRIGNEGYSFRDGWIIGDNAPAQVDLINGGGAGGDGFVHLGNRPGSGGTVLNVSGVNGFGFPSELMVLGEQDESLIVGVEDIATMNVIGGGHVLSSGAVVARELTASGSKALVSGATSSWEVDGHLTVGGGAEGRLTVEDQGMVDVEQTLFIGGAPTERPKPGDGGSSMPSVVLITGPASSAFAHQSTVVGFDLTGELVVEARGELHTDLSGYIAFEPSSRDSSVIVSTRGGWDVGQDMFVGYNATGTLQIESEGSVKVGGNPSVVGGNANIASFPSAGGSMATVSDSGTWQIEHDLIVGDQAEGGLAIDTKGKVTLGDNATIGDEVSASGSWVTVSTDGLWDIGADLRVGNKTEASLQVDADGLVNVAGNAYLGSGGPGGDGVIRLIGVDDTVATLSVQGDLFVGGDNLASIGRGNIAMEGKTLLQANRVVNWNQGELHLAGVLDVGLNDVENRGLLSGEGRIIGDLINHGGVSPGTSTGSIEVTGDFSLFAGATLFMELASETDFDQLTLASNSMINAGILDVDLLGGFQPSLGDQFHILNYGVAVSGAGFSSFHLPMLNPGLTWETGNLLTTGILEVVPLLLGDFDFDGDVDGADFILWQRGGSYSPLSAADLASWQANYGMTVPLVANSAAVPEPATLLTLCLLSLLLSGCRARFMAKER